MGCMFVRQISKVVCCVVSMMLRQIGRLFLYFNTICSLDYLFTINYYVINSIWRF